MVHSLKRGNTESDYRIWRIWLGMLYRCNSPRCLVYPRYGGRGITVCPEWSRSLDAFRAWSYENGYGDHLTIDRIDNDDDYRPGNCRWVGPVTQSRNAHNNVYLYAFGEHKLLVDWVLDPRCTVNLDALRRRRRMGWSPEVAIAHPKGKHRM